jgi:soluble lytic murein transglycosylase-like protein
MLFSTATSRVCAALILSFSCATVAASAQETEVSPEASYASVLRTINPHLQHHQSMAFARSIIADAQRTDLDPRLIMALVTVESSWRPNALSHSGARGLGQLMPTTAATLGVNPWDPAQNLRGASTYLRTLLDRFAGRGPNTMRFAIGAYNAGPQAVERFGGIPPYSETQNYVKRVLSVWRTINARVGKALATAPATADSFWLAHAGASALPEKLPPPLAPAPPVAAPMGGSAAVLPAVSGPAETY